MLDGLELGDGAPELLALEGVVERALLGAASDADALRGDHRPGLVEELHQLEEAAARRPDEVLLGDADVVEDEFGGVRGADAELARDLVGLEAVAVGLDDDLTEAVVAAAGVRVGLAEHDEEVADRAVRDPHLVAVDHPLVAVLLGGGGDAGDVGAGVGLGDGRPHDGVAGGDGFEEALFLVLRAERHDGFGAEAGAGDTEADAGVGGEQFLDDDGGLHRRVAGAAVLQGDAGAEQAGVGGLVHDLVGELLGLVVLAGDRFDLVLGEALHLVADGLLLVGESEVHAPVYRTPGQKLS